MDVKATGLKSLFSMGQVFFGTGMITVFFHRAGMMSESSDHWKIGHHAGTSSSAHVF